MEIEEVAAHNADVYNPGRGSTQKRKREKAQEQLRNRMRRRNNGTSSSVVSTRLRNSSKHDKGEVTFVQGVTTVWNTEKHNSNDEWKAQETRYSALAHPARVMGDKKNRHGDVPLGELVDRVMQRRGHTTTDSSPMTIRAIKPPVPPFAIQQPSLIRKMVQVQPINKRKSKSNGPYVVVIQRGSLTENSSRTQEPKDLPPLKQQNNSDKVDIGTWRPELVTTHEPYIHPNAEDRSVTNYRLQLQQAIKIAELRCDFSNSTKPMHKHAPLPAIQVSYEVSDEQHVDNNPKVEKEAETADMEEKPQNVELKGDKESLTNATRDPNEKPNRFTSSKEVLNQMQARKRAKRRKVEDFKNPLRTRNRYTAKSKQFKEDLQKVRELSIIQEDQSSISERLSRLSAGRTSVASFRSVASLKRIEEAEVPGFQRIKQRSDKSRGLNKPLSQTGENNSDSLDTANEIHIPSEIGNNTSDPHLSSGVPSPGEFSSLCSNNQAQHISSDNDFSDSKVEDETNSGLAHGESNIIEEESITGNTESITGNTESQNPTAIMNDESNTNSLEVDRTSPEIEQNMIWVPGTESPSPDQDNVLDSDVERYTHKRSGHSQDECEDVDKTSKSQINESHGTSEKPPRSEDDSRVVMETRLDINKQTVDRYGETESNQGIPALDTFDRRDIILPAERVQ